MTAQVTVQCLPVKYPKPILAQLLNSLSQVWEMILSQNTTQLTLPIKEPAKAQKEETGGG